MKFRIFKILILAFFFTGVSTLFAFSQKLQISAFSGYTFGDRIPITGGKAKLGDGHTYGGMFAVGISDHYEIELMYSRQDAKVSAYSSYEDIDVTDPVSVNYIVIGGNRIMPVNEKLRLFSGIKLGASIIASKDNYFDNITKFAVIASGGMKYFFTPKMGLRLQANLGLPMVRLGGGLWWSPGGGTSVGISGWSPIIQFGFTGGLVINLN